LNVIIKSEKNHIHSIENWEKGRQKLSEHYAQNTVKKKIREKRVSIINIPRAFFHLIEPLYDIAGRKRTKKQCVGDNASSFFLSLVLFD
jgi:hypothetical protein